MPQALNNEQKKSNFFMFLVFSFLSMKIYNKNHILFFWSYPNHWNMSFNYANYHYTLFFIAKNNKKDYKQQKVGSRVVFDIITYYYDLIWKIKYFVVEIREMERAGHLKGSFVSVMECEKQLKFFIGLFLHAIHKIE